MFINNLNDREKKLAIATIAIISIAITYALIIAPLYSKWKELNNQARSKASMLETGFKLLASQKQVSEEYSKLSKYARASLSEEEAVADTLALIESISKDASCLIVNIKPVGVTNTGSYKEILIDISAEAGIDQFAKFLYDIENPSDKLMSIKRFTLIPKSGQAGTLKGTFIVGKILLD